MDNVITIGRQFGSGGREIGSKLADRYNVMLYDKDLLKRAAKESGMCTELFENNDEKPTSSFLYNLVSDSYTFGYSSPYVEMPLSHKVFLAQFDTIKKAASEGPCVIVGRCADYALGDMDNVLNLFIHADEDSRIDRIMSRFPDITSRDKARDMILKKDRQRQSYYDYYSSKKWGHSDSYDLSINSAILGIEGTAEYIIRFVGEFERSGGKKRNGI